MSANDSKNVTPAVEPTMITIENGQKVDVSTLKASDHVKALNPVMLVASILVGCLGAIIGLELITRVGVNQNTSITGVLIAVVLSLIPGRLFRRFKNIHAQNLIQTSISASSYAAANAMMLPICIPVLMGRNDLMVPVLIGVALATVVDGFLIYKVFDSPMFAATNPYPSGIATAETLLALANRGKRSLLLFAGMAVGAAGKALGIPMDLFGVSWFGNVMAMMAFALGSIVNGSLIPAWAAAVSTDGTTPTMIAYLPHGIMIGAGLISLIQAWMVLSKKGNKVKMSDQHTCTVSMESMRKSLLLGFGLQYGGFFLSFCDEDLGFLFAFCDEDGFPPFTLCSHLLFHSNLDILWRCDVLYLHTVDLDAPRVGGFIEHHAYLGIDVFSAGQRFVKFQFTDDISEGGGSEVFDGVHRAFHTIGIEFRIGYLEINYRVYLHGHIIFGDDRLRRKVYDFFLERDFSGDLVYQRDLKVQTHLPCAVVSAESFHDICPCLRYDPDVGYQQPYYQCCDYQGNDNF